MNNDLQSVVFPCHLLPLIEANETLPVQCVLMGAFGVEDRMVEGTGILVGMLECGFARGG